MAESWLDTWFTVSLLCLVLVRAGSLLFLLGAGLGVGACYWLLLRLYGDGEDQSTDDRSPSIEKVGFLFC